MHVLPVRTTTLIVDAVVSYEMGSSGLTVRVQHMYVFENLRAAINTSSRPIERREKTTPFGID
jgi:hypothetical protein